VTAVKQMRPMQPGDVTATHADISKLAALTGYAPKTAIEQGLPWFVEWYRGRYG
jgi:UDP-glucuronate 4-epimerase